MQNNEVNQLGGVAHQIESTRDNPQRYRVYSMFGISPAVNYPQPMANALKVGAYKSSD